MRQYGKSSLLTNFLSIIKNGGMRSLFFIFWPRMRPLFDVKQINKSKKWSEADNKISKFAIADLNLTDDRVESVNKNKESTESN